MSNTYLDNELVEQLDNDCAIPVRQDNKVYVVMNRGMYMNLLSMAYTEDNAKLAYIRRQLYDE